MKKHTFALLSIFSILITLIFLSGNVNAEVLSPSGEVDFTKESSNLTPQVGDIFTYTLTFNANFVGTLPINIKVIDANPVPSYLSIIQTSVTGGGVYDPGLDGIIWEGTLVPGSLPHVVTFQMLVTGIPDGVASYDVTNIAYMIDTDAPGSIPFQQASVVVTLYRGWFYIYFPFILR